MIASLWAEWLHCFSTSVNANLYARAKLIYYLQGIHDTISSLLHHHAETAYFHFNESLFKPYENLIMLDLCDQCTQVITTIADP